MRKAMAAAVVALVVGAPMLPHQEVLASDRSAAGYSTKAGRAGSACIARTAKLFVSRPVRSYS